MEFLSLHGPFVPESAIALWSPCPFYVAYGGNTIDSEKYKGLYAIADENLDKVRAWSTWGPERIFALAPPTIRELPSSDISLASVVWTRRTPFCAPMTSAFVAAVVVDTPCVLRLHSVRGDVLAAVPTNGTNVVTTWALMSLEVQNEWSMYTDTHGLSGGFWSGDFGVHFVKAKIYFTVDCVAQTFKMTFLSYHPKI